MIVLIAFYLLILEIKFVLSIYMKWVHVLRECNSADTYTNIFKRKRYKEKLEIYVERRENEMQPINLSTCSRCNHFCDKFVWMLKNTLLLHAQLFINFNEIQWTFRICVFWKWILRESFRLFRTAFSFGRGSCGCTKSELIPPIDQAVK